MFYITVYLSFYLCPPPLVSSPLFSWFALLHPVSESSYIYNISGGEEEREGVYRTIRPLHTWKQPPHLVRIIGAQIFETSFFIFQTIDRLIYELALEFHCRKATDEKITERKRFVFRERKWIDPHVLLRIPSLQARLGFVLVQIWAGHTEISDCFCYLKSPLSVILNFMLCVGADFFFSCVIHEYC